MSFAEINAVYDDTIGAPHGSFLHWYATLETATRGGASTRVERKYLRELWNINIDLNQRVGESSSPFEQLDPSVYGDHQQDKIRVLYAVVNK